MPSVWNKDFSTTDTISAIDILNEQCDSINKKTDGIIIGRVTKYDGPIESYNVGYASALSAALGKGLVIDSFNVQDELGEIPRQPYFKYEFYITSKNTPDYKYRILFLQFGLGMFPVKVVLDDDISKEIGVNEIEALENPESFLGLLYKILNSDKITSVIISLINVNKIKK